MNDAKLKNLVAEAVSLDREIQEQQQRLKLLKTQIVTEAESRPDEHMPTDGGGNSVTLEGADGCVARVTFPAPKLKSSISGEGKAFDKIKDVAGAYLTRLLQPAVAYKPVPDFRNQAMIYLGQQQGKKLIKLCQSESSPNVSFETKEVA